MLRAGREGFGFRTLGFRVWGLGLSLQISDLGFRGWGCGFKVLGCRDLTLLSNMVLRTYYGNTFRSWAGLDYQEERSVGLVLRQCRSWGLEV